MKLTLSVIMPAINNADMCATAVRTLREHAKMDYQLIFVDNGSPVKDGVADAVRPLLNRRDIYLRNEVTRSFARANNQGLAVADGEYIVGLNNDVVVEGDWQTPLLTEGVKYDLCGTTIRRLVVCEELELMLCHRPDGKMADAEPSEPASYVECWLYFIKASLFRGLNGFDEAFWPMYCEDSDLSYRVKATGGKIGKVEVPIRHLQGMSTKTYYNDDLRKTLAKANEHKLYARWVKGAIL